ncbi:hypothetical protein [Mesorhizobium sp. CAU 1741]|uniref:hypothetical protein n=1 Tax=Mesorhizobium sp. CAU 1741 TaxID=3140366 RepID=UPI00325A628E
MSEGPTVINTGGGGSGGWAVAIILAVVLVVGALWVFGGLDFGGGGDAVTIDVPAVTIDPAD